MKNLKKYILIFTIILILNIGSGIVSATSDVNNQNIISDDINVDSLGDDLIDNSEYYNSVGIIINNTNDVDISNFNEIETSKKYNDYFCEKSKNELSSSLGDSVNTKTYMDLKEEIDEIYSNNNDSFILNDDYTYVNGENITGILVSKDLRIDGNNHVITGLLNGSSFILFNITQNATLTINNVNFSNCFFSQNSSYSGSQHMFYSLGNLVLNNCSFEDISISAYLISSLGNLVLNNCSFENISSDGIESNNVSIISSHFKGLEWDSLNANEGSIFNSIFENSNLNLKKGIVSYSYFKNIDRDGFYIGECGFFNSIFENSNLNLEKGIVSFCDIKNDHLNLYNVNLSNSNFTSSTISLNVGLVENCSYINSFSKCSVGHDENAVVNVSFSNSNFKGKGIELRGNASISNCHFENMVSYCIDALDEHISIEYYNIAFTCYTNAIIENCSFSDSKLNDSAAISISKGKIINCNFTNISSNSKGGAIYTNRDLSVVNCKFIDNFARLKGSNIYNDGILYLKENNMTKDIAAIYNNYYNNESKITSPVTLIILNNDTKNIKDLNYTIFAQLVDDMGNYIEDSQVILTSNNIMYNLLFDGNNAFELTLKNNISNGSLFLGSYDGADDLIIKTGVIITSPNEINIVNGVILLDSDGNSVNVVLKDLEGNFISNANILYSIDGGEYISTSTDSNGQAIILINENSTINVVYIDENRINTTASLKVIVINNTFEKIVNNTIVEYVNVTEEVPVSANASIGLFYEDGLVIVTLKDLMGNVLANKSIFITIGDENVSDAVTDKTGIYSLPVSGNVTVTAIYTDNNGASVSGKIVVKEINNTVEKIVERNNTVYVNQTVEVPVYINNTVEVPVFVVPNASISLITNDGSSVILTLTDNDGKAISNANVQISKNGEESIISTDANGKATISVNGNTTFVASYKDSNNLTTVGYLNIVVINTITERVVNNTVEVPVYINNTVEKIVEKNNTVYVNVTPNRTATRIIYSNMTTVSVPAADGRIGKYFEVTLVDANGKPLANKDIAIGFNGKSYPRTTNETGGAKLQINLAKVDKYTFAIAFLGDDNYTGSFEVALITVNPQVPKLTASAKSFKSSAKTKSISATFKTANGNAVKGKQISFTVNGKTYTAKTNSKGVATVKISLNKKGTYSAVAKFAGDTSFKATSTKFNVKIA